MVDMPPRIFVEDYYVNLLALYRHVKVSGPLMTASVCTSWSTAPVPAPVRTHHGARASPTTGVDPPFPK